MPNRLPDTVAARALPDFANDPDRPPACRHPDIDPDLFYPGQGDTDGTSAKAKAICGRCPVEQQCLDWAIATDQRWGVWGGQTPPERDRTQLRRAAEQRHQQLLAAHRPGAAR